MNKINFDFKDKTEIITGGAQGFGFDIGYPLLKSRALSLEVYSEFNTLSFSQSTGDTTYFNRNKMTGSGITLPGLRASCFGFKNISFH